MRPLAIFDVDGTLIDSRHVINLSMARAFECQGLTPPSYEQTRKIVGLSLEVAIDKLAPRALEAGALEQLVEGYKAEFVALRNSGEDHEQPYDGALELLSTLKSSGWALGIATGKSRRGLDAVLKRHDWAPLFECHYCASDGAGKPDPFMVNANLSATASTPQQAVIIGDTSFDMLMGKRAGITSIGVTWGFHTEAEIRSGGADSVYGTVGSLSAALRDFASGLETDRGAA